MGKPSASIDADDRVGAGDEPPRYHLSGVPIVALGASAGGLEAFQRFFDAMPDAPGIAFVLVQHLAPDHESLTPSLIARHTVMPATAVVETTRVEPDHIYVIAPDTELTLVDDRLEVGARTGDAGHWRPIDRCFASLARARGAGAVAVILSGTGADGTAGAREIGAGGGLVIAQHPESAGFAGMAESAIEAGVVDHVLSIEDMPAQIIEHLQTDDAADPRRSSTERDVEAHLSELLALVKARAQFDLSEYRPGTPIRRIARRMELNSIRHAPDYLDYLKAHPAELNQLVQDLFIGVTRFFRDPAAFEHLAEHVIAPLIADKPTDGSLRLWVAGCASGEEVYSLAILIAEGLAAAGKHLDVTILATDINDEALAHARRGQYSGAAVGDLTVQRRRTYFNVHGSGYQIRRELRDWVTFAHHDLLSDPAFAALDLITCRNVLIYFAAPVQARLLGLLHHALNADGYLWLGQSETVGAQALFFDSVSRGARLFRRIGPSTPQAPIAARDGRRLSYAAEREAGAGAHSRAAVVDAARRALLEDYAPASVVIDGQHDILHFQGDIQAYLKFPSGEALLNLKRMARRGLVRKLTHVIQQATRGSAPATAEAVFKHDGASRPVEIVARPLRWPDLPEGLLLVSFVRRRDDVPAPEAADTTAADDEPLVAQLEYELQVSHQESQHHIQRLEEANEETAAINEELQASNEEMEASKEELQALNEELRTVNADLQEKFKELEAARNDWQNLLVSTDIATIFLDRAFNICRFTPAAEHFFHLIDSDQGRPLGDIASCFDDGGTLASDAQGVLDTLVPSTREVLSTDGYWYDRRIQPYRTSNDSVEGVVVTFIDMTARKRAALQVEAARAHAEHMVEALHEAVLVLDADLCVISANRAFYAIFDTIREEIENQCIFEIGDRQWDIPRLRSLLEQLLSHSTTFEAYEVAHDFPGAGERVMLLNACRLDDIEDVSPARILLAMTDITHQKRESKRALASSENRYRVLFDAIPMLCFTVAGSGRIRSANRCAEITLGVEEASLIGRDFVDLHPEDAPQLRDRLAGTRQPGAIQRWEARIVGVDGEPRWMRETACVVGHDSAHPTVLVVCEDITDERRLPKLVYHASHDPLTGLLNRREFERRANQLIENARSEDETHVMGFIDLDQFKIVNDTSGHLAGDAVLRQVAQMLRARMRGGDVIARLGGDEFGLLLGHCDIASAEHLTEELLDDMQALRASSDDILPVGMSIGLTAITAATTDLTEVLGAADAACYQAKVQGRHRSYVYHSNDQALTQRHGEFEWVSRVAHALEDNRLRLVYQAIVPIANTLQADAGHEACCCELLLRLIEPDGRCVPATQFLPAVERYGLVSRLDQWVIATAFDWLREQPAVAKRLNVCAINISAQSLNDEQCLSLLCTRLADGSVAPDKICLEITETAAIQYMDGALHSIEMLKSLGCHFALDDFGSGLASFAYLKALPVDFLKIDGALMPGLVDNAVDQAMVTSINEIAHLMDKQTVAEGIEDRATLAKLQDIGVDFVQGYALSVPRALEDFI